MGAVIDEVAEPRIERGDSDDDHGNAEEHRDEVESVSSHGWVPVVSAGVPTVVVPVDAIVRGRLMTKPPGVTTVPSARTTAPFSSCTDPSGRCSTIVIWNEPSASMRPPSRKSIEPSVNTTVPSPNDRSTGPPGRTRGAG